jgi:hypothetical protein
MSESQYITNVKFDTQTRAGKLNFKLRVGLYVVLLLYILITTSMLLDKYMDDKTAVAMTTLLLFTFTSIAFYSIHQLGNSSCNYV